eukprot:8219492-Pyramimonas_sp.AAC.1
MAGGRRGDVPPSFPFRGLPPLVRLIPPSVLLAAPTGVAASLRARATEAFGCAPNLATKRARVVPNWST